MVVRLSNLAGSPAFTQFGFPIRRRLSARAAVALRVTAGPHDGVVRSRLRALDALLIVALVATMLRAKRDRLPTPPADAVRRNGVHRIDWLTHWSVRYLQIGSRGFGCRWLGGIEGIVSHRTTIPQSPWMTLVTSQTASGVQPMETTTC